jgi:hypothetical protein
LLSLSECEEEIRKIFEVFDDPPVGSVCIFINFSVFLCMCIYFTCIKF